MLTQEGVVAVPVQVKLEEMQLAQPKGEQEGRLALAVLGEGMGVVVRLPVSSQHGEEGEVAQAVGLVQMVPGLRVVHHYLVLPQVVAEAASRRVT